MSMASSPLRALVLCTLIAVHSSFQDVAQAAPVTGYSEVERTIQLVVDGRMPIATIGDEFLCATLDWWPATKCNYNSCPWQSASILHLNLDKKELEAAITALAPLRLRLGGTLQDLVVYDIGSPDERCRPFFLNASAQYGFSGGCLPMPRWDALNRFFKKTQVSVAFGLNILYGEASNHSWNPSNARQFISYTHGKGYPVTAWELGNELLGGISPQAYGENMKRLRALVDDIYKNDLNKPLVIAPDSFYEVGNPQYQHFLAASGPNVVDVVTRHIYNLGPGRTATEVLVGNILSRVYADEEEDNYAGLQGVLKDYPWATAWVGESGGAFNSGHKNVTDAFIIAFWYLDQLGLASKHNNQAFCRQSLIGGHYGLLDAVSKLPNPDFYGALLWQRLMGTGVLSVDTMNSTDIRAYAHCQKSGKKGDVTLLLLNYNNVTSVSVNVSLLGRMGSSRRTTAKTPKGQPRGHDASVPRLEYHMTPAGGDIHSHVVLLNGNPLFLTASGQIPKLVPRSVDSSSPVILEPLSYAYVVVQDASVDACASG